MLKKILTAAMMTAFVSVSAQAQTDDTVCGGYAAVGGVIASEMLDLTLRDVVGMMQNKRPDITAKIASAMESRLTPAEMLGIAQLPGDESSLLGEASGVHAMNVLMSGQASSADEVSNMLKQSCLTTGYKTVISNQRQINGLTQGR